MKACKTEKGLTLVEVLAALAILGIVFIGIMTIFPQMTLFNAKTEAKLDTMNLARQEMAVITAQNKWTKTILLNPPDPATNVPDYLEESEIEAVMSGMNYNKVTLASGDPGHGILVRFQKSDNYLYEADIYLQCEKFLTPVSETPPTDSCEEADRSKLYKIHLKLLKENVAGSGVFQVSSETYSFINYRAVEEKPPASEGD